MKPKHQRMAFILVGLLMLGGAAALTLSNFKDNIVFYFTPTELLAKSPVTESIRLGGLVKPGSVTHGERGSVSFLVTDGKEDIAVHFTGALPSLFREGQGVVAEGRMKDGALQADRILAKHDEKYMPPEVARMLKEQGHWEGEGKESRDIEGRE